jgi:hypothetical protein
MQAELRPSVAETVVLCTPPAREWKKKLEMDFSFLDLPFAGARAVLSIQLF